MRPTFETGRGLLVESYLIDFDADLYGQNLRVAFVERLRGEKRFSSSEELVEAMSQDVERRTRGLRLLRGRRFELTAVATLSANRCP